MKSIEGFRISLVLIALVAVLAIPATGFAVDPDMQSLVIDNGSGMSNEDPANCGGQWNNPWNRLDQADRMLDKIMGIDPAKKSAAKRKMKLCERTYDLLADLEMQATELETLCPDEEGLFEVELTIMWTEKYPQVCGD